MDHRPSRRAWLIVAGGFVAVPVSAGLMRAEPVFLLALVQDFGRSRAEASLTYSVGQIVGGVTSPLVGNRVDRIGARRTVLPGGCVPTARLRCRSQANALRQVVLLCCMVMTLGAMVGRADAMAPAAAALLIEDARQHLLLWLHACFFGITWGAGLLFDLTGSYRAALWLSIAPMPPAPAPSGRCVDRSRVDPAAAARQVRAVREHP